MTNEKVLIDGEIMSKFVTVGNNRDLPETW